MKNKLNEKAKSKAQQRLMGVALSVKRGEQELSDLPKSVQDKVKDMQSMSEKELEDFASTKHKTKKKTLPNKVEESIDGHYMNSVNIDKLHEYSKWLKNHVPKNAPLYNWMESKLAQAADDISEVKHKLEYKLREHGILNEDAYVGEGGDLEDFDFEMDRETKFLFKKKYVKLIDKLMANIMEEHGFMRMGFPPFNKGQVFNQYKRPSPSGDGEDMFIVRFGHFLGGKEGIKIIYHSHGAKEVEKYERYTNESMKDILDFLYTKFQLDKEFTL